MKLTLRNYDSSTVLAAKSVHGIRVEGGLADNTVSDSRRCLDDNPRPRPRPPLRRFAGQMRAHSVAAGWSIDTFPRREILKILLAVNGRRSSEEMLTYLVSHREMFAPGHEYTIFTALEPVPLGVNAVHGAEKLQKYYSDEAGKIIAPAVEFLSRHGIDVTASWLVGSVSESIAQFANHGKFNMLVMGAPKHGALMNLVSGSVPTKVLAHSEVPVLLV